LQHWNSRIVQFFTMWIAFIDFLSSALRIEANWAKMICQRTDWCGSVSTADLFHCGMSLVLLL
jgi:hypothetical protein